MTTPSRARTQRRWPPLGSPASATVCSTRRGEPWSSVAAQADADPDSAQALAELSADRRAALNALLKPSGVQVTADEYPLLYGPVIARIVFERAEATDAFIASVVAQWLAGRVG